jgi:uncharacterized protein (TIGR02391 family)
MTIPLLDRIKKFQTLLLEAGVARSILALPAPRMLALPAPTSGVASHEKLFGHMISEPEIVEVSRDLFVSGFYNQAVCEALKALDKFVQAKSGNADMTGAKLMQHVFGEAKPVLEWSKRKTISEKDQHNGYQRLFAGSMIGIRNPCTHEHEWVNDPDEALECITIAQHLLRKAKASTLA